MKLAVMQPYFLPYIGYFHLLDAADTFVILDTVKYPKGGWVNRNRILIQGRESWLTVPVASGGENIFDKSYILDKKFFEKVRSTVTRAYPKAHRLTSFLKLIEEWQDSENTAVSEVNMFFIIEFLKVLERPLPIFIDAGSLDVGDSVGQERILRIAKVLGASQYINLPGGETIYDKGRFEDSGVELLFVQSNFAPYRQRSESFVPRLSALDFFLNEDGDSGAWFGPRSYQISPPHLGFDT